MRNLLSTNCTMQRCRSPQLDQSKLITLEYRESTGIPNIKLTLPNFVLDVFHLPAYTRFVGDRRLWFCADRLILVEVKTT